MQVNCAYHEVTKYTSILWSNFQFWFHGPNMIPIAALRLLHQHLSRAFVTINLQFCCEPYCPSSEGIVKRACNYYCVIQTHAVYCHLYYHNGSCMHSHRVSMAQDSSASTSTVVPFWCRSSVTKKLTSGSTLRTSDGLKEKRRLYPTITPFGSVGACHKIAVQSSWTRDGTPGTVETVISKRLTRRY